MITMSSYENWSLMIRFVKFYVWTCWSWGYDHSIEEEKSFQNQVVPVQHVPFLDKISAFGMIWTGTSWFFFFSWVIIASVEGDHIPSQVFIASWSTLFMHEILCMKMLIAMNCCCSCMIFLIMAMKYCWSWMISTDWCIISWPLAQGLLVTDRHLDP